VIYLALVVSAGNVVLYVVFGGLTRSLLRQQARERERLMDQVFHAARNPWNKPPAATENGESFLLKPEELVADIEQEADYLP